MTNNELKNKLQAIIETKENTIEKEVALEVTSLGNDEIINSFSNILNYGSDMGMVSSFIYYKDTHKFFETHYNQIEELRYKYENNTGLNLYTKGDLKHTMAWFGFQQTAYNMIQELGLDI